LEREKVVISVGGSVIHSGKIDIEFLKDFAKLITKLSSKTQFVIFCGGGRPARDYANGMRELKSSEFAADEAATLITRANAHLVSAALGEKAYPRIMEDFIDAAEAVAIAPEKIVLMGGTVPGITTDTDAALVAEKIGAKRLINLSNVDAIYNMPPNLPGAKKFTKMTHEELVMLGNQYDKRTAGTNFVFDCVACKIIARSGIETHFVGKDIKQIEAACEGKKHGGTVVEG